MSQRRANSGEASKPQASKLASIFKNLWRAKGAEIRIGDLSSKDIVIAVMGPTGTGKSTFIEVVTGVEGKVGHTLESCTSEISVVKLSFPGVVDSDICFVDTPGFDDTRTSDSKILKMIADWLNDTYNRQIQLTGLLYFHRISDNLMWGTALKNLHMFEKLCGHDFRGIVLVTTMWDEVERGVGEARETQLKWEYFKHLIDRGSSVRRFYLNQKSAFDILAPIIDDVNERKALLLQKEMNVLGLKLNQTTAGRTLYSKLVELVARHQKITLMIRSEMKDPTLDREELETLMNDYKITYTQLQRANKDLEKMKISVGEQMQRVVKSIDWTRIFGLFSFNSKRGGVTGELEDHQLEDQEDAESEEMNLEDGQDNNHEFEAEHRHGGHHRQGNERRRWQAEVRPLEGQSSTSAIQGVTNLTIGHANITMTVNN